MVSTGGAWTGVLFMILLLMASALISGSEVAYFSLTTADIGLLREEDSASAKRILSLKQRPHALLATILISNNFVNIAIVLLSEFVVRQLFPDEAFDRWAGSLLNFGAQLSPKLNDLIGAAQLATGLRFALTVIGVTFLLVLFGEVTPKVYARAQNLALARFMSAPIEALVTLLNPLSHTLVRSGNYLESRLRKHQGAYAASKEEIDQAIDLTMPKESPGSGERDILKRLVTFGDVTVRQIMRSRPDVVAVAKQSDFTQVLELVRESSYSRIPVYDEDLDSVVGILYAKDLIRFLKEGADFNWWVHLREEVLYVPESKKINDLLRAFQAEHRHMAIVVDEFGGTSGLVTLEDVLEEVIGDIKDEFDEDTEIDFVKIDDHTYRFEGKTQLSDALRVMGLPGNYLDSVRGEADTLAGVILEHTGVLPRQKEQITVGNLILLAETVTRRRIERIRITLPSAPPGNA